MLTRSTEVLGLVLILGVFLMGCRSEESASNWCGPNELRSEDVVVLSTDFGSSSVDVLRPECSGRWEGLFVGGGDLTIRLGQERLFVLDRATNGSVTSLDFNGEIEWQAPLDGCGAHDLIELSSEMAVVTCYDDASLRLVRTSLGEVAVGPSLTDFSDEDGIPEMDHGYYADPFLVLSVQRLDRRNGFQPTGPSLLVRTRITMQGLGQVTFGPWETIEVDGLENPVTQLDEYDGVLRVGCAGNWRSDASSAGLATFEIEPFSVLRTEVTESSRMWQLAGPWWIGSIAQPESLEIEAMILHRGGADARALWQAVGFSVGGLAEYSDGGVFVALRSATETPAVLRFDAEGVLQERFVWPYLPWELAVVP